MLSISLVIWRALPSLAWSFNGGWPGAAWLSQLGKADDETNPLSPQRCRRRFYSDGISQADWESQQELFKFIRNRLELVIHLEFKLENWNHQVQSKDEEWKPLILFILNCSRYSTNIQSSKLEQVVASRKSVLACAFSILRMWNY